MWPGSPAPARAGPTRGPGRGVRDAGGQAAIEEPLLPGGQVHQPGIEQRQAGDLGQPPARTGPQGDDGFVQDGGHRFVGVPGPIAASAMSPRASPVRAARAAARTVAAVQPPVARSRILAVWGPIFSSKPLRHSSRVSSGVMARSAELKLRFSARRRRSAPGGSWRARTTRRCSVSRREAMWSIRAPASGRA